MSSAREGPPLEIRGALVQPVQSPSDEPEVGASDTHFYFNESTVVITAAEGYEAAIQAFENLRGANPGGLAVAPIAGVQLRQPASEDSCQNLGLPPIQPLAGPAPAIIPTGNQ